jgi:hypothetical protein
MPSPARPTIYARRGYSHEGRPLTYMSWDEADRQSAGYEDRWVEDGDLWMSGATLHVVKHVVSPSWRCREPLPVQSDRRAA